MKHHRDLLGRELLAALEEHGHPLLRRQRLDGVPELAHAASVADGVTRVHEGRRMLRDGIAGVSLLAFTPADEPAPAPTPPLMVQAAVDEDAVKPGRELGLAGEGARRLVEPNEGFLGAVLGLFPVAHDGPGDAVGPLLVTLHEEVEGSPVPFCDSPAERFIGRFESLHRGRSSHMVVEGPNPWAVFSAACGRGPRTLPLGRRLEPVRLQGQAAGARRRLGSRRPPGWILPRSTGMQVPVKVAPSVAQVSHVPAPLPLVPLEVTDVVMPLGDVLAPLPLVLTEFAAGLFDPVRIAGFDGIAEGLPIATDLPTILANLAVVLADPTPVFADIARVLADVPPVAADVLEVAANVLGAGHARPQRHADDDAGHHGHSRRPPRDLSIHVHVLLSGPGPMMCVHGIGRHGAEGRLQGRNG